MNFSKQELEEMMKQNGGWLDLSGTPITSLPEGLTVGGWLGLSGTAIKSSEKEKVRYLQDGDYVPDKYIYCDEILTHIRSCKKIGAYAFYKGKIKGRNVVSDGQYFAHCTTVKEGVLDIEFKKQKERGTEQYNDLTKDSVLTYEEAIATYRIITGACRQGTQNFLNDLKEKKDSYTIAEIIELTKGQYGSAVFAAFFERKEK